MKILIPVILDNCVPKKDKSASIRFTTAIELSREQHMNMFDLLGQTGVLYFKAEEGLTKDEVNELDSLDIDLHDSKKTQSKRIRDVLYIQCQQHYNRKPTDVEWKDWYRVKTETIIQQIKNTLE